MLEVPSDCHMWNLETDLERDVGIGGPLGHFRFDYGEGLMVCVSCTVLLRWAGPRLWVAKLPGVSMATLPSCPSPGRSCTRAQVFEEGRPWPRLLVLKDEEVV